MTIWSHGRRKGRQGVDPPLNFEKFSKKSCFLSFEWENQILSLLAPLEHLCKNPLVALLEKIHPNPCVEREFAHTR